MCFKVCPKSQLGGCCGGCRISNASLVDVFFGRVMRRPTRKVSKEPHPLIRIAFCRIAEISVQDGLTDAPLSSVSDSADCDQPSNPETDQVGQLHS